MRFKKILVTATDGVLFLEIFRWVQLFCSVDSSTLNEPHSHLELVLVGAWQTALEQEAALPFWLLRLAVLEVV